MSKAGDRIAELARHYVGCSLTNRRGELAELVACEVDDPGVMVGIKTNCATFVRGLMCAEGVVHERLEKPYVVGMAMTDVLEVAKRFGALSKFAGQPLKRGSILHYAHPGTNDDHVEVLLEDASADLGWRKSHCGGGRAGNAISEEVTDVRSSGATRRPLLHVIDPDLLLEAI